MIPSIFSATIHRHNVESQFSPQQQKEIRMNASKLLILAVSTLAAAAAGAAPKADLAGGEKIYNATCVACHGSGVLSAPKLGDKAAWAPRIKQGVPTLYKHALEGFKMMPAKGGNAALKDSELQAAIDFMVSKAS
jgi:cytochrome c5